MPGRWLGVLLESPWDQGAAGVMMLRGSFPHTQHVPIFCVFTWRGTLRTHVSVHLDSTGGSLGRTHMSLNLLVKACPGTPPVS
jgi:hypothetical protein